MVNPPSNAILEWINQVLENLLRTFNIKYTYDDKDDPYSRILAAPAFTIFSTENGSKCYIPCELVFLRDMILPIKDKADWELIRQKKHMQINKDNNQKNSIIVDHD